MQKLFIALFFITLTFSSSASAITITTFTDRAAWESAVNGTIAEDHFYSPPLIPGLSYSHGVVYYPGHYFLDDLGPGSSTTWSYAGGLNGFGADWDTAWNGSGAGLRLTALFDGGSQIVTPNISNTFSGQFFGIFSDTVLTSIKVETGTAGGYESYHMDRLAIGTVDPEPTPVPEPSTLLLFLVPIALIGLMKFKDRQHPSIIP